MTHQKKPRFFRRLLSALSGAFLGKASDNYMKQYTPDDERWDRAIAASGARHLRGSTDSAPGAPAAEPVVPPAAPDASGLEAAHRSVQRQRQRQGFLSAPGVGAKLL